MTIISKANRIKVYKFLFDGERCLLLCVAAVANGVGATAAPSAGACAGAPVRASCVGEPCVFSPPGRS